MTFVEKVCSDCGYQDVMSMQLALEEVVVNVMQYAYAPDTVGAIEVHAELKGEELLFVVEDEGRPFNPTKVPDIDTGLSAEERSIGGLGIFIVRQTMDDVRYSRRNNHNILTLTKIIKR